MMMIMMIIKIIEIELNTQTDFSQWTLNTLNTMEGFVMVTEILWTQDSDLFWHDDTI